MHSNSRSEPPVLYLPIYDLPEVFFLYLDVSAYNTIPIYNLRDFASIFVFVFSLYLTAR